MGFVKKSLCAICCALTLLFVVSPAFGKVTGFRGSSQNAAQTGEFIGGAVKASVDDKGYLVFTNFRYEAVLAYIHDTNGRVIKTVLIPPNSDTAFGKIQGTVLDTLKSPIAALASGGKSWKDLFECLSFSESSCDATKFTSTVNVSTLPDNVGISFVTGVFDSQMASVGGAVFKAGATIISIGALEIPGAQGNPKFEEFKSNLLPNLYLEALKDTELTNSMKLRFSNDHGWVAIAAAGNDMYEWMKSKGIPLLLAKTGEFVSQSSATAASNLAVQRFLLTQDVLKLESDVLVSSATMINTRSQFDETNKVLFYAMSYDTTTDKDGALAPQYVFDWKGTDLAGRSPVKWTPTLNDPDKKFKWYDPTTYGSSIEAQYSRFAAATPADTIGRQIDSATINLPTYTFSLAGDKYIKLNLSFPDDAAAVLSMRGTPKISAIKRADVSRLGIRITARDDVWNRPLLGVEDIHRQSANYSVELPIQHLPSLMNGKGLLGTWSVYLYLDHEDLAATLNANMDVTAMAENVADLPAGGAPGLLVYVPSVADAVFDSQRGSFDAKAGDVITLVQANGGDQAFSNFAGSPVTVWLTQYNGNVCPNYDVSLTSAAQATCPVAATLNGDGTVQFTVPVDGTFALLSFSGMSGGVKDYVKLGSLPVRLVEADSSSGGSTGSTAPATHPLNDTGIVGFSDDSQNGLATEPATHPGQDARFGRDAQTGAGKLTKIGGGSKGFDFTKIANDGSVLSASAALGSGPKDWACTRDNVTGLIWEVKTTAGLRSQDNSYTWYDSNPVKNGGNAGTAWGGSCATAGHCDTERFIQDVNAANLCGASDWRMPSASELFSIVDNGAFYPTLDATWFPNTPPSNFWSASADAYYMSDAFFVSFFYGSLNRSSKSDAVQVRLVRAGQ